MILPTKQQTRKHTMADSYPITSFDRRLSSKEQSTESLMEHLPAVSSRIRVSFYCFAPNSLLTDLMARVEGQCAESITTLNWPLYARSLRLFAIISVPASIVNAGLKWFQALMAISLRWQLSHYLHTKYMTNRSVRRVCSSINSPSKP